MSVWGVGRGISDITPSIHSYCNGYFKYYRKEGGIHSRLFCRTFFFEFLDDTQNEKSPDKKFFFHITLDYFSASASVKTEVVKQIQKKFGEKNFNDSNVCICSNGSCAAPCGGLSWDSVFNMTCGGFDEQRFNLLIERIMVSVRNSVKYVQRANIYVNEGLLKKQISCNASPNLFTNNPKSEREDFEISKGEQKTFGLDQRMVIMKITSAPDSNGLSKSSLNTSSSNINDNSFNDSYTSTEKLLGVIVWFPLRACTLTSYSCFLSAEIFGCASSQFERYIFYQTFGLKKVYFPGFQSSSFRFMASFCQSEGADASPNFHVNFGRNPCCYYSHDLSNRSGPGENPLESLRIISNTLFKFAYSLVKKASLKIEGSLFSHTKFVHFGEDFIVESKFSGTGSDERLVEPQIGDLRRIKYNFDTPISETFDRPSGVFKKFFEKLPSKKKEKKKENERPLFFDKKDLEEVEKEVISSNKDQQNKKVSFFPQHLPLQVIILGDVKKFIKTSNNNNNNNNTNNNNNSLNQSQNSEKVGNIVIVCVPCEMTTMGGRRLRQKIMDILRTKLLLTNNSTKIVIQTFSNDYSFCCTTPEEFDPPHDENEEKENSKKEDGEKDKKDGDGDDSDTDEEYEQSSEAALTIFGRQTLNAYIQEFSNLFSTVINAWINNKDSTKDLPVKKHPYVSNPPLLILKRSNPTSSSGSGSGNNNNNIGTSSNTKGIGTVLKKPQRIEYINHPIFFEFLGSDPRNMPLDFDGPHFVIERSIAGKRGSENEKWRAVRNDSHLDTLMTWKREDGKQKLPVISINWQPSAEVPEGFYRFKWFGCKTNSNSVTIGSNSTIQNKDNNSNLGGPSSISQPTDTTSSQPLSSSSSKQTLLENNKNMFCVESNIFRLVSVVEPYKK